MIRLLRRFNRLIWGDPYFLERRDAAIRDAELCQRSTR